MNNLARCAVALAASIPLASGCYTYVPTELDSVPDGGELRVYLTRSALTELPQEAAADRPFLRGSLERRTEGEFVVRVPTAGRQTGYYSGADIRQEVRVSAGDILEVRRRELDGTKSGLMVAAAAGAATAILVQIMDTSGSPPRNPSEGPPTKLIRVPVFSIPSR